MEVGRRSGVTVGRESSESEELSESLCCLLGSFTKNLSNDVFSFSHCLQWHLSSSWAPLCVMWVKILKEVIRKHVSSPAQPQTNTDCVHVLGRPITWAAATRLQSPRGIFKTVTGGCLPFPHICSYSSLSLVL